VNRTTQLTQKQLEMLDHISTAQDFAVDIGDYQGALGFRNRERVADPLIKRGLVTEHAQITEAGREALALHLSERG
jgi:hypothetical protein